MGVEENLRLSESMDKALNARDWEVFDDRHAESVVAHSPMAPEPTKGLESHRDTMKGMLAAFPDMHFETVRSIGQGDWVAAQYVITGTHKGPLPGPGGQMIPPTNKPMRLSVCGMMRIEGDKIAEEHIYFDTSSMMAQLGLMPHPSK